MKLQLKGYENGRHTKPMTDDELRSKIPDVDPLQDALTNAGMGLVAMAPVVGGLTTQVVMGRLSTQHNLRAREFMLAVCERIERLDGKIAGYPDAVFDSAEFLSRFAQAHRVASETASDEKRRWLADSLMHAGPWSTTNEIERVQFFELVDRYTDLHMKILRFHIDAKQWLRDHTDWVDVPIEPNTQDPGLHPEEVSPYPVLHEYVFPHLDDWHEVTKPVMSDLVNDGLIDNDGSINWQPIYRLRPGSPVIKARGQRFIDFIGPDGAP